MCVYMCRSLPHCVSLIPVHTLPVHVTAWVAVDKASQVKLFHYF